MKIRINTIDLHGWKHELVKSKLLSDVIMRVNEGMVPLYIITGNSIKMKTLVENILTPHDFKVESTPNSGMVKVY
jgi:hypothetical protein